LESRPRLKPFQNCSRHSRQVQAKIQAFQAGPGKAPGIPGKFRHYFRQKTQKIMKIRQRQAINQAHQASPGTHSGNNRHFRQKKN